MKVEFSIFPLNKTWESPKHLKRIYTINDRKLKQTAQNHWFKFCIQSYSTSHLQFEEVIFIDSKYHTTPIGSNLCNIIEKYYSGTKSKRGSNTLTNCPRNFHKIIVPENSWSISTTSLNIGITSFKQGHVPHIP